MPSATSRAAARCSASSASLLEDVMFANALNSSRDGTAIRPSVGQAHPPPARMLAGPGDRWLLALGPSAGLRRRLVGRRRHHLRLARGLLGHVLLAEVRGDRPVVVLHGHVTHDDQSPVTVENPAGRYTASASRSSARIA